MNWRDIIPPAPEFSEFQEFTSGNIYKIPKIPEIPRGLNQVKAGNNIIMFPQKKKPNSQI
jgi:hypothetical protein